MDGGAITSSFVLQVMEEVLTKADIVYENNQANNLSILSARFKGGYAIHFTCTPDNDLRCTLKGIMDEKVEDHEQRGVAGMYFAKINYPLNIGKFTIDTSDGEVVYQSALPVEGMSRSDCVKLLLSWFKMFMGTFAVYTDSLRAIIGGQGIAEAEAAADKSLKEARSDRDQAPSEAMVTSSFVIQAMEKIFSEKNYVYEVQHTDSVYRLKASFTGGYVVRFSCSQEHNVRGTLSATLDDKVEVQSRRSVAAEYFAKVNYSLTSGKFELDVRDGEVMYGSTLPLKGMTQSDCTKLLPRWFSKFMLIIDVYISGIKRIIEGGSIAAADAAEAATMQRLRGGAGASSDGSPPSSPSSAQTAEAKTVRLVSPGEDAFAAQALKELLLERGDLSSLETHVEGDLHVVQGVYEYEGEKAVIWARDQTEERVLEMRVFMVDFVSPRKMEALSQLVEKLNANIAVGGFKIDREKGLLFYGYSAHYGRLTGDQLKALVRGKALRICLGTHLEFLPSIKAVLNDVDGTTPSNDSTRTTRLRVDPPAATEPGINRPPPEAVAFGHDSAPNGRQGRSAPEAMPAVPLLAVEDLDFLDEAGRGGMGVVRRAVYRKGAEVAVKELLPTLAKDDYDLFVKEMQLHFSIPPFPHIVPMVGVTQRSKTDRALRLVTDWCNGGSLQGLLDDAFGGDDMEVITFGDALKYARHIAAGVDHLHRHKLLHLDLKPGNVLLDRVGGGGKARLTDFGLSKIISNGSQTSHRVLGGTYGFMAPEVIEPAKYTKEMRSGPHTDVFALGVTIFLLFFGFHRPYKPNIPGHAISQQVCRGLRPEFPVGFSWPGGSRVTDRVKSLVQGCWTGDPERRPSVAHVLNILYQIESMVKDADGMDQKIHPQTLPTVTSFML